MPPTLWADIHGASTHFPVVLTLAVLLCDFAAVVRWEKSPGPGFRTAGPWLLAAAALSTVPAVFSGLIVTRGEAWGAGALRWHHLFVWPAFALIIGAAVWRMLVRASLTRRGHLIFLSVSGSLAVLTVVAARFGGELLHAYP